VFLSIVSSPDYRSRASEYKQCESLKETGISNHNRNGEEGVQEHVEDLVFRVDSTSKEQT